MERSPLHNVVDVVQNTSHNIKNGSFQGFNAMNITRNKNSAKRTSEFPNAWEKLSYAQKFTIITLIFALPVLAFAPLAYEQYQRTQQYGVKEEQGTIYLRNLWQLTGSLQAFSIASIDAENGNANASGLVDARAQANDILLSISRDDEIANELGLSFSSNEFSSKLDVSRTPEEINLFLEDISDATREVGDKSFLILDPDLDTYYLMDAVLLRLPENQDRLFRVKILTQKAIQNNGLTTSEAYDLQNNLAVISQNLDEIARNLAVASENNMNQAVDSGLLTAFEAYSNTTNAHINDLRLNILNLRTNTINSDELDASYKLALTSSTEFYDSASAGLQRGIQNRTRAYSFRITLYITVSLVGILLAFVIGNRLMRSISTPLQKAIEAAGNFAAGDFSTRIDYVSNDEAGQIIKAFNRLADEVETRQTNLEIRSNDLENKTRKIETISKVAREITSFRDLSSLLSATTNLIHENFGYYHVGIFLLDNRKEYAVLTAANSEGGKRMLERGHMLKVGETGIVGYVAQSLQARIAHDVGVDAVFFNNPDLHETRSELALPLVVNTQILGVLDVQSTQSMAFTEEDITTLQTLAEQLAIAIQNARLFTEAEKALETARLAYGEQSREAWSKMLHSQSKIGFLATPPLTVSIQNDSIAPGILKAIESGDLILGEDNLTICVPVKIRGQVIGAIRLRKSEIAEAWTQDETNLAIALSDQLSGALESARLYRDSLQRAARESLVSEISGRITASSTRDAILRETVQELGQSIGNVSVTFQLLDKANGGNQAQGKGRGAKVPASESNQS
jgi:GAF domain-containing protein/HAMP domain-containing protein